MNIKQIKLEKNKMDKMLYDNIYKAIADFKDTTGLEVNSISIQFYELNNIHGEIVMVIDYDSGASKAYRIERTTKVVEI